MNLWHKFVSASVLLTVLLVPFSALVACVPSGNAPLCHRCCCGCCRHRMPLTATSVSPNQHLVQPPSCCQNKPQSPAPATLAEKVLSPIAPDVFVVPVVAIVPALVWGKTIALTLPPRLPDRQIQLCTFRI